MIPGCKVIADSSDRPTWLAARQNYVGSSDVAAMLGESKYMDRAQLIMLKAGLAEPFQGNETTRHGMYMEPYFIGAARGEFGWVLEPYGLLVEDRECPALAATPDFVARTPWGLALVQTKFVTSQAQEDVKPRRDGKPSEAAFANGAPLYYQLQQQAELACTGLEWNALLVLHAAGAGFKLRSYLTRRHAGVVSRLRAEATRLMADVEALKAGHIRRTA